MTLCKDREIKRECEGRRCRIYGIETRSERLLKAEDVIASTLVVETDALRDREECRMKNLRETNCFLRKRGVRDQVRAVVF